MGKAALVKTEEKKKRRKTGGDANLEAPCTTCRLGLHAFKSSDLNQIKD